MVHYKKTEWDKEFTKLEKKVYGVFNSLNRVSILFQCHPEGRNISQLARELNISYPIAFYNVKYLEEIRFVKINNQEKKKSRPSIVKTTKIAKDIMNKLFHHVYFLKTGRK